MIGKGKDESYVYNLINFEPLNAGLKPLPRLGTKYYRHLACAHLSQHCLHPLLFLYFI